MNITLRQLRAFVAVAQMGGFSAAAQRLHLTQSALSMLVRALENDMGVALFERTTRKVKLTDAGREFFPSAEQLLVGLHEAVSHTRAHAQHGSGRLTMAVTPVFATTVLPAVLAQYRHAHPDVQIVMRDDAAPARIQRLVQDGEVDLGVGPIDRSHLELLAVETLMEDQLVLACPIGHRLARAKQVTWRELPNHPLIGFGRDNALQMLVNSSADAAGITLRVSCEVSSIATAVALVEAGLGIAVLPSYTRSTGRPHKLHFRLLVEPAVTRALSLMSLRDRVMPPVAQAFMEMLRVEMRRRAADRSSTAAP
jgi:LysR family transcriptional regulator, carnitine catabolism transcriptional activator